MDRVELRARDPAQHGRFVAEDGEVRDDARAAERLVVAIEVDFGRRRARRAPRPAFRDRICSLQPAITGGGVPGGSSISANSTSRRSKSGSASSCGSASGRTATVDRRARLDRLEELLPLAQVEGDVALRVADAVEHRELRRQDRDGVAARRDADQAAARRFAQQQVDQRRPRVEPLGRDRRRRVPPDQRERQRQREQQRTGRQLRPLARAMEPEQRDGRERAGDRGVQQLVAQERVRRREQARRQSVAHVGDGHSDARGDPRRGPLAELLAASSRNGRRRRIRAGRARRRRAARARAAPRGRLGEDPFESERRECAERRLRQEERPLGVADVQAGDARARVQQRSGQRERETREQQQREPDGGAAPPAEESERGEQQRRRPERAGDLEGVVARTRLRGVDQREAEERLMTRRTPFRARGRLLRLEVGLRRRVREQVGEEGADQRRRRQRLRLEDRRVERRACRQRHEFGAREQLRRRDREAADDGERARAGGASRVVKRHRPAQHPREQRDGDQQSGGEDDVAGDLRETRQERARDRDPERQQSALLLEDPLCAEERERQPGRRAGELEILLVERHPARRREAGGRPRPPPSAPRETPAASGTRTTLPSADCSAAITA